MIPAISKDKGLPFGESLPEPSETDNLAEPTAAFGMRLFQLKQYLDEVSLHNLGHEGKEIVLIKHLTSIDYTKIKTTSDMAHQILSHIKHHDPNIDT
jgi:hypothetical protein